jgi:amino acid transporter
MKKTVLTFGLIAGAILSVMMLGTLPFHDAIGFDRMAIVGYTSMVLAFLLIYFGVRSYRDNVAGGTVRFGRAFVVGALIAAVASACYVATWQVIYYNFTPDFMEKYQAHALEKARAGGESEAEIAKRKADMDRFAEQYRNPVFNVAVTFLEPLPVALIVALVSAGVLSRRRGEVGESASVEARVPT